MCGGMRRLVINIDDMLCFRGKCTWFVCLLENQTHIPSCIWGRWGPFVPWIGQYSQYTNWKWLENDSIRWMFNITFDLFFPTLLWRYSDSLIFLLRPYFYWLSLCDIIQLTPFISYYFFYYLVKSLIFEFGESFFINLKWVPGLKI